MLYVCILRSPIYASHKSWLVMPPPQPQILEHPIESRTDQAVEKISIGPLNL
jgi:hypothetical protein